MFHNVIINKFVLLVVLLNSEFYYNFFVIIFLLLLLQDSANAIPNNPKISFIKFFIRFVLLFD